MQLLTTDDRYHRVKAREYPLSGVQAQGTTHFQNRTIRLADGPHETPRRASYADLYHDNPWVFACIQKIAYGLQRLPLQVFQRDGDSREHIDRHTDQPGAPSGAKTLAKMVHSPHEGESGRELFFSLTVDFLVYGNALLYVDIRDGELWRIPWKNVEVKLGDDEPISAYVVRGDGLEERTFLPTEVVHFGRGSDPASVLGLSPLRPLAKSSGLMDAIHRYLNAYFENQARPSGHLQLPPGADEETLEFIQGRVDDMYASPENSGRVAVTTGEWQHIAQEPEHSESIKLAKLSREEVCAALQVPMAILGVSEESLEGMKLLRSTFYRDVVGPVADRFEQDLEAQLLPMRGSWKGLELAFDMDSILRPDMDARGAAYRKMRFLYTLNELREQEGLDQLDAEGADEVWVPANEVPLSKALEQIDQQTSGPEPNDFGDGVENDEQRPGGNEPDPENPDSDTDE